MWSLILKNAKGNFSELEKLLEGVDDKYLPGGFYFPRADVPNALYEELWLLIRSSLRGWPEDGKTETGGFDIIEDGNHENYQYRLWVKPLVTPTPSQASSWKGLLIKPETIAENWKTPEDFEEHKKRREQLNRLHDAYPDTTVKNRWGRDSIEEDPKYTPYREEYDEWVKDNMKPESEREAKFSTKGRIGNRIPESFVAGGKLGETSPVSPHVDKEAWDKAHKGHFKLKVFHKKKQIININIQLKLGIKPPPRNPWSYGHRHKLSMREGKEVTNASIAWNKYWKEYEKYQKSEEYKAQGQLQKALMKVFGLAREFEIDREDTIDSLFE